MAELSWWGRVARELNRENTFGTKEKLCRAQGQILWNVSSTLKKKKKKDVKGPGNCLTQADDTFVLDTGPSPSKT